MTWSKINTIHEDSVTSGAPLTTTSDEFITPQRANDEIGILHLGLSPAPGLGTASGYVFLEAKLHANAPWSRVWDSFGPVRLEPNKVLDPGPPIVYEMDAFGGDWFLNCPILPWMRAHIDTLAIGAGTSSVKVTIQE